MDDRSEEMDAVIAGKVAEFKGIVARYSNAGPNRDNPKETKKYNKVSRRKRKLIKASRRRNRGK